MIAAKHSMQESGGDRAGFHSYLASKHIAVVEASQLGMRKTYPGGPGYAGTRPFWCVRKGPELAQSPAYLQFMLQLRQARGKVIGS